MNLRVPSILLHRPDIYQPLHHRELYFFNKKIKYKFF